MRRVLGRCWISVNDGRSRSAPVGRKEWKENGLGAPCRTMGPSSHLDICSHLKPKLIRSGSCAVRDHFASQDSQRPPLHRRRSCCLTIYIVRTLFSFTLSEQFGGRFIPRLQSLITITSARYRLIQIGIFSVGFYVHSPTLIS